MLVNGGKHVKLVDFGLATRIPTASASAPKQASPRTAATSTAVLSNDVDQRLTRFCGTPHYMSPEIVKRVSYGRPADVWAMGVLLYMLLSGETLWEDAEPSEVCASVKRGQWSFSQSKVWNHKSAAAKELIQRMLEPNPKARLTAFSVCCADWLHVASDKSRRNFSASNNRRGSSAGYDGSSNPMHSRHEDGGNGGSASGSGGGGRGDVVYSHAMMRSVTFQETLDATAPSSSKLHSPEVGARLGLLHKREYLHVHVSQLVQFCSAATTKKNGADEALGHLLTTVTNDCYSICLFLSWPDSLLSYMHIAYLTSN
jgi:serine/threonine protein kinase